MSRSQDATDAFEAELVALKKIYAPFQVPRMLNIVLEVERSYYQQGVLDCLECLRDGVPMSELQERAERLELASSWALSGVVENFMESYLIDWAEFGPLEDDEDQDVGD